FCSKRFEISTPLLSKILNMTKITIMNLTKEPVNRLIIALAVPAGTAMMFDTLYNVTATYFASLISTTAVAGLSMSFLLYMAVVGVGSGFASALTALIGNSLGRRHEKLAKIYAAKGIAFVLIFALSIGSLGFFFAPGVLAFFGANSEFLPDALEYIRVIFLATPFFLLIKSLNGILAALGDTKTLRNWLFYGLFINGTFCFTFVKILGFGVGSVALATALVQFFGTIFILSRVRKTGMINFTDFASFAPDMKIYGRILKQAVPSCLNHLSMSLGGLVMLKFLSYYGTDAVAGYGIALRIEQIVGLPTIGIAVAALSVIAQNYGAKEYKRVKECYKSALKIVLYYCLFACAFCIFCGTRIIEIFDAGERAVQIGQSFLLVVAFIYFGYGVMNVSGSTLQGLKRPFMLFVFNALRQIVLQTAIFSFIVFVLNGAVTDIWLGMFCNVYLIAGCFLAYTIWTLNRVCK
ncbi:MAG: MATE family efflux transporter, partial [Campylobacter sp.]|nr:MATE family efflux transporter [Campylobacter sp.]